MPVVKPDLAPRRIATDLEREVIAAVKRCSLPPANRAANAVTGSRPSKKRFIRDVNPDAVTDRQANYALLLAYHFRRQLSAELVQRVWTEWLNHPERLDGFTLSGDLARFYGLQRR